MSEPDTPANSLSSTRIPARCAAESTAAVFGIRMQFAETLADTLQVDPLPDRLAVVKLAERLAGTIRNGLTHPFFPPILPLQRIVRIPTRRHVSRGWNASFHDFYPGFPDCALLISRLTQKSQSATLTSEGLDAFLTMRMPGLELRKSRRGRRMSTKAGRISVGRLCFGCRDSHSTEIQKCGVG